MKIYLLLFAIIVLASCNNNSTESATAINDGTHLDSLIESNDSINSKLLTIDTLATKAYLTTQSEIRQLRQEKKDLVQKLETKYPNYQAIQSGDEHLKRINELNGLLVQKEFENAQLRRRIQYDSIVRTRTYVGQKLQKLIEKNSKAITPGSNSLVIKLDKKIKGDGEISDQIINVYIIEYTKKSKKLMRYDLVCDMIELNKFNPRLAMTYEGQYFFNDLPPGKYLIKVCSYYGNYKVIEREKETYQEVVMQVAPPIQ